MPRPHWPRTYETRSFARRRSTEATSLADMRQWKQDLRTLALCVLRSSLPDPVMAQLLQQNVTQTDDLVQLNKTPRQLFAAPAGHWLQQA
jgi:hypothetical protein